MSSTVIILMHRLAVCNYTLGVAFVMVQHQGDAVLGESNDTKGGVQHRMALADSEGWRLEVVLAGERCEGIVRSCLQGAEQ